MSVVPLMPVVTGTKTASFLFLRTNTPCSSSLGLPLVRDAAWTSASLDFFSGASSLRCRMVRAWIGIANELLRDAVVIRAVVDSPGRRFGGGSWIVTTTLKSFASWLLDVDWAVETPVERKIALLPISVTTPLNRCLGIASIETSAG